MVPGAITLPGGKPVIDDPGESPRLRESTLLPVFVTVDEPRTEYWAAVASCTFTAAAVTAGFERDPSHPASPGDGNAPCGDRSFCARSATSKSCARCHSGWNKAIVFPSGSLNQAERPMPFDVTT